MNYWLDRAPPTRIETHYGDRRVRCFAERPLSLHAMFADAVRTAPEHEALVCEGRRWTWRALDADVARLAGGLAARGVARGDRVALVIGNQPEFVVVLLAVARLGAIVVPLSVREQTPGLAYALDQCRAAAVVAEAEHAVRLPADADVPHLKLRVVVGGVAAAGTNRAADPPVAASGGAAPAAAPGSATVGYATLFAHGALDAAAAVDEDDVAAILYTSGTTGRPKGAELTHLSIVHSALHYKYALELDDRDRCVATVPLSHVTGLLAKIAAMICCRGALVILPAFKAADFLALAARERMTYTLMVPAMYALCLLQDDLAKHDLSAWRIGGYGGAPMPVPTIERMAQALPHTALFNAYGATETTSPATILPAHLTGTVNDSVGLAVACGELKIVDDDGREVAPGSQGEVWIRGPMVVRGYWDNAEATAREITDGWWHSGDIGSLDGDGFLRVFDRKKDVINRGGYKVFSAEVESTLVAHPAIVEAAVIGRPCPVLGERVHAVVVARAPVAAESLRSFCAERLADYKVPETFTLREAPLPRNANGKVLKRELRAELPT